MTNDAIEPSDAVEPREDLSLRVLEFHKLRELLGRFLVSPLARSSLLRLCPFRREEQMRRALAQVNEMVTWLEGGGKLPLAAVSDLRPWLARLATGGRAASQAKLAELLKILRTARRLRRILVALEEHPELKRLGERFPDLATLTERLENTIDDRGAVMNSASKRLGRLRAEIQALESRIQQKLNHLLQEPGLRKHLSSSQVVWRNGRPALQVKPESRRSVPGILHDRSQSGQTVFIEPQIVVELANHMAEVRADENAELQRILAELLREIQAAVVEVKAGIEGIAWVDFTNARARLVRELGFVVPELSDGARICLRGARHPLLLVPMFTGVRSTEELYREVVPLDLDLSHPYRMIVITGPNTGGKTVALKTVGLLILMAMSGMPVPAEVGTALPFLDGIHADIGDEQAIEQSLSTFSSHITRITKLLSSAGQRSLVLLDELGAGTDPEEGGALGYAILEELYRKKVPTMASTHLGKLKDFAYQHENALNGAMSFDPKLLCPLFRLEVGIHGSSNALHIAERVGLPASLVARAKELSGEKDKSIEEMIDRIQSTRMAAEEQRRQAEKAHREAKHKGVDLAEKALELDRRLEWLREEAEQFVDEELRTAREILKEPLRQFLNAPLPYGPKAEGMLKLLDGLLSRTSLGRRRDKFLEGVKKGQMVYVPRFRRSCKVQRIDRKKRVLGLELGGVSMHLPFHDVSWLKPLDS